MNWKQIIIGLSFLGMLLINSGCTTPLTNCHVTNRVYEAAYDYEDFMYIRGYPVRYINHMPYKRYIILSGINSAGEPDTEAILVSQEEWDNVKQNQPWKDIKRGFLTNCDNCF